MEHFQGRATLWGKMFSWNAMFFALCIKISVVINNYVINNVYYKEIRDPGDPY